MTHTSLAVVLVVTALLASGCPNPRGGPCDADGACPDELVCEPRDDEAVCVPAAGGRIVDEPCVTTGCGIGFVCIEREGRTPRCLVEDFGFCKASSECVSEDCVPRQCPNGVEDCSGRCADTVCAAAILCPCAVDDDCTGGEVCAGSECGRRCEPAAARGDACITRVDGRCDVRKDCAPELACVAVLGELGDGACVPPTERAPGELCNRPEDCASGTCASGACG